MAAWVKDGLDHYTVAVSPSLKIPTSRCLVGMVSNDCRTSVTGLLAGCVDMVSWPCPVCQSEHADEVFQVPAPPDTIFFGMTTVRVVRCRACDLLYQLPRLSDRAVATAYREAVQAHQREANAEGGRSRDDVYRWMLARVEKYCQRGTILDVGCGIGAFVHAARKEGWDACGLEPSSWAASFGRAQFRLTIYHETLASFEESHPGQSYEAISMLDMLEHSVNPRDDLRRVNRLLKDEGILLVTTVNAGGLVARRAGSRWWLIIPEHLIYFNRKSLTRLLGQAGFEIILWRPLGRYTHIGSWRFRFPFDDQIILIARKVSNVEQVCWRKGAGGFLARVKKLLLPGGGARVANESLVLASSNGSQRPL